MPVSRFDQGIGQDYVSTYIPQPLGLISQLAATHANKYRSALDDINKTNLLQVNADPRNVEYRDAYLADVNNRLTDLSDRIIKEGYTPKLQAEWLQTKNAIVSDPNRLALENAHKNYELYLKDLIENQKNGIYSDIYNPYKGKGSKSQVTPFNYQSMRVKQDYIPIMDKAIDSLKADSKAWEAYAKDKSGKPIVNEFGQLIKKNGEVEELTASKLQSIAKTVAPTFFQSKESQYYIDEAFGKAMPEFNNLPKEAQDALLEKATNDLIRRGSTQLFSKKESGIDMQNLPARYFAQQDANLTTSSQSEAIINDEVNDLVKGMEFDSKGNFKVPIDASIKNTGTSKGSTGVMGAEGLTAGKGKDLNKMTQYVKFYLDLQKQHPDLKGLTPQETIDAYNKANKSLSAESIPLESISNVAAKNIGDAISRNKNQRNFYLWDSKGKTTDGTLQTVLKKLDIKEEDFDKALQNGIGGYTQAGPNAGSYYVEVKDEDGETRRVMISPDQEMQKIFRTSQAVNTARKSLTPTTISPIEELPNYKILVNPTIGKNGNVNWEYMEVITDNNGNPVKSNKTTLDAIRASERNRLKQSGYLGSNLGVLKDDTTE